MGFKEVAAGALVALAVGCAGENEIFSGPELTRGAYSPTFVEQLVAHRAIPTEILGNLTDRPDREFAAHVATHLRLDSGFAPTPFKIDPDPASESLRVVLAFNPVRPNITGYDLCREGQAETARTHRLGTYVLGALCTAGRPLSQYEVRAFRPVRGIDDPLLQRLLDSMTGGLLPAIDPATRDSPCNTGARC